MKKLHLFKTILLLCALIVGSNCAWAATGGFSLGTTTTVPLAANADPKTTTISGSSEETWNIEITGNWTSSSMQGSQPNKYWQMGKNGSAISYATFSTSGIPGTITQVVVACYSYSSKAKVNCSVGGSNFGTQNQSTASDAISNVTFSGSASGNVIVTLDNTADGARAVYIRSITVTYSSTFTVTYDDNGASSGNVPVDATAYAEKALVTVLGNTGGLTKTNYQFGGWNTKADGSGTTYAADGTFSITKNTILYALWNGVPYTVTMPENDSYGTYSMSPSNDVPYGSKVTLTYTPASGKELYGAIWSVDGEKLSGNTFTMPAKNVIVTVELSNEAKLPFEWLGGTKEELQVLPGVTGNGLGDNYAAGNAPYRVKFDTTNDNILIKTNGQPGKVTFEIKIFNAVGASAGTTITIQGSSDGTDFSDLEAFNLNGKTAGTYSFTTTASFAAGVRFIKVLFTKGTGEDTQNVGVGPISIALPEPAEPTVIGETVTVPVSVKMDGWRSFIGEVDQNYTIEDGAKVYYVSETNAGSKKVTLTEIAKGIPANTPVILHKDGATSITLTKTATVIAAPSGNKLAVSTAGLNLSAGVYRLGYKTSDGVGFYKYSSASAPAGIIYISALDAGANFLSFDFGDVTGIESLTPDPSPKGEGSEYYNLNGQRVAQPAKGLYIVNGRKVIVP